MDSVRWIHDRMVIHRTMSGEVDSLSGITEDITEARELEDQLRQAQKMEAVGRLAGGVAHDFNNVMTVILGYSAVLLQEVSQNSSARQFVQEIQRAGERCAALTNQLLTFSRKQMLHPVSLDLHRVIRDLLALLKSLIGEHITIVLQLDAAPRWVKVDAVQLEQVLLNFAVNARDAMPHGGTLTIDTDQVFPDPIWGPAHGSRSARTYVRLRVHDTGAGIDSTAKPKIFEPFFTTKPVGQGTGLGLSTVYGIVHQSGGRIAVESAVGQGTTMTVFLPEVTPPRTSLPPVAPALDSQPGTEVILLVEDEPSVRLLTQHILRTHGYTVHEAGDGFQALDLMRRQDLRIDLVVTDLVMPGMNGKELVMQLRGLSQGLKVIYMSGYSESTPITGDESHGQATFLQKPFSPDDLIHTVYEHLNETLQAHSVRLGKVFGVMDTGALHRVRSRSSWQYTERQRHRTIHVPKPAFNRGRARRAGVVACRDFTPDFAKHDNTENDRFVDSSAFSGRNKPCGTQSTLHGSSRSSPSVF